MSTGSLPKDRQGFNFTDQMRMVCEDMVNRLPELGHIDLSRVAMAYSQVRTGTVYGVRATMTPLRFEAGADTVIRQGQTYTSQRLFDPNGNALHSHLLSLS